MQAEQVSAGSGARAPACDGAGAPAPAETSCVLLDPAEAAVAWRWRRLAAACLRVSVWRLWAAGRAADAAPMPVEPQPPTRNLLMDTMEGRIAMADALVASAEQPSRPKRQRGADSVPPVTGAAAQPAAAVGWAT